MGNPSLNPITLLKAHQDLGTSLSVCHLYHGTSFHIPTPGFSAPFRNLLKYTAISSYYKQKLDHIYGKLPSCYCV